MPELTRSEKLAECQRAIGYKFRNPKLLATALTHSSAAAIPLESYERMEFLGDAVLGLVIGEALYRRHPDLLEGPLSIIRGHVVSGSACARIARSFGLDRYLIIGKGLEKKIPDSILANVTEAVIAAIYLDGGYDPAHRFIGAAFHDEFEAASLVRDSDNHKSELQSLVQHQPGMPRLTYLVLDVQGPEHLRCFKVQAKIGERLFQAAWGNTKKSAEQKAAENAVAELEGEAPPWPDGD